MFRATIRLLLPTKRFFAYRKNRHMTIAGGVEGRAVSTQMIPAVDGATESVTESATIRQKSNRLRMTAPCGLFALIAGLTLPHTGLGVDSAISAGTAKYFRELRYRGLFRLAENYCLERLSHSGLSPVQKADLTLELARTLAEHALVAGDPEQTKLWNRSESTLAEFLKQEPNNPRRLLLEAQAALLPVTIGHTRRLQAELQPLDTVTVQRAVDSLNEAVRVLREFEAALAERMRNSRSPRTADDGELRLFEIRALATSVHYRLGSTMVDLAHLQAADSPERAALLLDAQKLLKSPPESEDLDLMWMSRVSQIECSRLLGDFARTLRELSALEQQSPPPEIADRLLAERVRTLMAQQKFSEASALFDEREHDRRPLSGELALLQIQVPIVEWQATRRQPQAPLPAPLRQQLEQRANRLRRDVGGYWSLRADLALQQMREVEQYGAVLANLAGRAQAAFNAGRPEEAIELYGEAAAQAHHENRADLAFQFGYTRASIEIKSKHWADAAADLLELADQFTNDSKTPEAHLLAAYALGRFYDEKPTTGRREEYARILELHRTRYGSGPTGPEATWMLARLDERRGKVSAALELYKLIPAEHKRAAAARVAVARCYEKILDRLRELREPLEEWQLEAVTTLQQMIGKTSDVKSKGQIFDAEVAVRLARILLRARPPQFAAADKLLARAEAHVKSAGSSLVDVARADGPADEPAEPGGDMYAQVRQLQVVSMAGQGRFQDARDLLHQISATSPPELLRIIDGIAPLQTDDRRDPFHDLGALQLEAALKLDEHRAELTANEKQRLDDCLARAYGATGKPERGIEIYERLLVQAPRDKSLLAEYAGLLMNCGTENCLKKALKVWQKREGMEQAATPEWFAIRFQVCHTLVLLKKFEEASKLLKVTRLLYPKIEDEKWQKKFAELEAECVKNATEKGSKGKTVKKAK